jgi:hypothetical protein
MITRREADDLGRAEAQLRSLPTLPPDQREAELVRIAGLLVAAVNRLHQMLPVENGPPHLRIDSDRAEIICGGASLSMKKGGAIVIKGGDITIVGSGKVNVKSSGDAIVSGPKIGRN